MPRTFVGVDPGPSTGLVVLRYYDTPNRWISDAFQCTAGSVNFLLSAVIEDFEPLIVAIEEFEVRRGSGGTTGKDAEVTKRIRHKTEEMAISRGISCTVNKPGLIKPWATDKRLETIGFPLGAKFKDARDAARHALHAAVKAGLAPDPLR